MASELIRSLAACSVGTDTQAHTSKTTQFSKVSHVFVISVVAEKRGFVQENILKQEVKLYRCFAPLLGTSH